MQALMKVAPGIGNVELREISEPETPPGHVKIEVKAAGICGTDLHIFNDEYRSRPPVVMGHEVAGQVVELGVGVSGVNIGERVTSETYFSTCGECRYCRSGRPNLCVDRRSIGSMVNGGFTRYLIVPRRNVHHLPENVDFVGGAVTEPLACVVRAALQMPKLTLGGLAVVTGPGAMGLLTAQVVKSAGLTVVVLGTDADESRMQLARELGADYTVNVQRQDPAELVMDLSGGDGADIVFECSGAGPAAQQLLTLVRKQGQYAQVGLFGKTVPWDLEQVCYKELSVTGSFATVPSAWPIALKLMAEGKVKTRPLVTNVLALDEWREAFDMFGGRSGVKLVFQP